METPNHIKLFDSHCHIDDRCYQEDFAAMLERAQKAGVDAMLIAGVDAKGAPKAVQLANRYDHIFAAVGIHPHDAQHCTDEDVAKLEALSRDPKVVAVGEIGLDFNRMFSPQKDQEKWFVRLLEMADQCELPIILHERDTEGRLLEVLEAHSQKYNGVIHCFSGNEKELFRYLNLGLHVGITGIVTIQKRGARLRQLVPKIPIDRILIETDAPYLTPAPEKNKFRRNEPAFVGRVLHKIAEVRGEALESLAQTIWNNTCRLFGIQTQGQNRRRGCVTSSATFAP